MSAIRCPLPVKLDGPPAAHASSGAFAATASRRAFSTPTLGTTLHETAHLPLDESPRDNAGDPPLDAEAERPAAAKLIATTTAELAAITGRRRRLYRPWTTEAVLPTARS
jgi:hypothetical protein